MEFELHAPYQPTGDQPEAIRQLVEGIKKGYRNQVLLGATGTGKTFTVANVIQELQIPTLVMTHNKTLAAQLYAEFREFFPNNAVEYFVSYYDYYQPEAYIPRRDLYIEKETDINEEIERLRLSATTSLMSRHDVIIVASVSAIYGLGDPEAYGKSVLTLETGPGRLVTTLSPEDAALPVALAPLTHLLTRRVAPLSRLALTTINASPAAQSPYLALLRQCFEVVLERRGVMLYRGAPGGTLF